MNLKKGVFNLADRNMEYITFGQGPPFLIIPGLGDGLASVGQSARQLYYFYRSYGKKVQVIVASRPEPVTPGATTAEMADEYAALMEHLGFASYRVLGISMGGMIAQFLAANYPQQVTQVVLALTVPWTDEHLGDIVRDWIKFAENGDYRELLIDTTRRTYSGWKGAIYTRVAALISRWNPSRDLTRFIHQAQACLNHDARVVLNQIKSPTLIISGSEDQITPPAGGEELDQGIPQSQFVLLENTGHGACEEKRREIDGLIFNFWEDGPALIPPGGGE